MSRNKYPEETYKRILDVSTKLFVEKGYDQTSLQDIIDGLGGMTKGAIYHHFRSKEDILIAVVEHLCKENSTLMMKLRDDPELTGKQKLEKMFSDSVANPRQKDMFAVTPDLLENPKLLVYYLKMVFYTVVPDYILPVIQQGVADGSIQTDYPEELAEAVMLMTDIWANPVIFKMSSAQFIKRVMFINQLFKPFGIELIHQDIIGHMEEYRRITERDNMQKP